jgi:hypothetical protein
VTPVIYKVVALQSSSTWTALHVSQYQSKCKWNVKNTKDTYLLHENTFFFTVTSYETLSLQSCSVAVKTIEKGQLPIPSLK